MIYKNSPFSLLIVLSFVLIISTVDSYAQSDLQTYTPSKLLEKGRMDFKLYNNYYTQTRSADTLGEVSKIARSTFFTSTFEMYRGISKKSKINVGVIANFKSNSSEKDALNVFQFQNIDQVSSVGITTLAASIKWSPFNKIANFSLQSSYYFPVFDDNPNGFYLDKRSNVWENKFFYDKLMANNKVQLFTELDMTYIFGNVADYTNPDINNGERFANNSLAFPISVFLSYFPTDNASIFINAQHYTLKGAYNQNFTLAGLGYKYQLTNELNIELSSSYFIRGQATGLGETYNFGLRYIL